MGISFVPSATGSDRSEASGPCGIAASGPSPYLIASEPYEATVNLLDGSVADTL